MSRFLERLERHHIDERPSICRHLVHLLASRPGHCRCSPALGLEPAMLLMPACEERQQQLAERIHQCIVQYEPRLTRLCVQPLPASGPAMLTFRITAELAMPARHGSGQASPQPLVFWLDNLHPLSIRL